MGAMAAPAFPVRAAEPLRVAFVGKGGAGKSMIAGTLTRLLAAEGEPVLALDSDPLPGLAFSAGLPHHELLLPDEAVAERAEAATGPRFRLREDPITSADRYAVTGADGLRLLQLHKTGGGGGTGRGMHAFRLIAEGLGAAPWHLVGDLPGGTRQAFFGWARWAELLLVVTEPGAASLLSARRLARLGAVEGGPRMLAVASLVEQPGDVEHVAGGTGLTVVAAIPRDPAVEVAERRGVAPIDHEPESPAVMAVRSLLTSIRSAQEPS
jgi:CO dehydrogenase maturation factor